MRHIALATIAFYRSTLKWFWIGDCKYHPSCSEYSVECLNAHPLGPSLKLIFLRILRCNPFSSGGYDPVPQKNPMVLLRYEHE